LLRIQRRVVGYYNLIAVVSEFIRPPACIGCPANTGGHAMVSLAAAVGDFAALACAAVRDHAAAGLVLVKGHVQHQPLAQAAAVTGALARACRVFTVEMETAVAVRMTAAAMSVVLFTNMVLSQWMRGRKSLNRRAARRRGHGGARPAGAAWTAWAAITEAITVEEATMPRRRNGSAAFPRRG